MSLISACVIFSELQFYKQLFVCFINVWVPHEPLNSTMVGLLLGFTSLTSPTSTCLAYSMCSINICWMLNEWEDEGSPGGWLIKKFPYGANTGTTRLEDLLLEFFWLFPLNGYSKKGFSLALSHTPHASLFKAINPECAHWHQDNSGGDLGHIILLKNL